MTCFMLSSTFDCVDWMIIDQEGETVSQLIHYYYFIRLGGLDVNQHGPFGAICSILCDSVVEMFVFVDCSAIKPPRLFIFQYMSR